MQKVLTAEQMREVDRLTTERYGIPSILLMENTTHAVARVITEKLGGSVKGKSILILCGKGNNGGDGAALARILWKDGRLVVNPLLFGQVDETRGDALTNFQILKAIDDAVATSGDEFNKLLLHDDDESLAAQIEGFLNLPEPKLVVDALFGTGLTRPLSEEFADAFQRLENHKPELIAIDIPSGLDANRGDRIGRSISATATVTFTAPKPANVISPASSFNGDLIVANIGSPRN